MPVLPNYHQFDGRHWETGSVYNYYDYWGVNAPHTGKPYSEALLPDRSPPLAETRALMLRQHRLFRDAGAASLEERQDISQRLKVIRGQMAEDFPLNGVEVARLQEVIAGQVLRIHDIEAAAIGNLKGAMGR